MSETMKNLEKKLYALAKEHFSQKSEVCNVEVSEGEDYDGDPVLLVRVVLSGDQKPDAGLMIGFISLVRERLESADEERFPMLSYVAASELGEFQPVC